jgi:protein involved in polysaccharide export with SLBB domain
VNVLVEEYVSKRVSVFGSVAKPGTFPLLSGMTVVQAISLAGGLTSIANATEVVITRRSGEKMRRLTVSITKITRGQASDVSLEAGDLVFVPERVF